MKRSSTGEFEKNKKLCLINSPTNDKTTSTTTLLTNHNTSVNKLNKTMTTLEDIKDMVLRLDKGDLEYCITKTLPEQSIPDDGDDISTLLQKALKNIAQRQLKLETENKRYRIAIKQQHHLLTHDDQHNKEKDPSVNIKNMSNTTINDTSKATTPEDCISSFRTSPMLEKLQLSPPGKKKMPLSLIFFIQLTFFLSPFFFMFV